MQECYSNFFALETDRPALCCIPQILQIYGRDDKTCQSALYFYLAFSDPVSTASNGSKSAVTLLEKTLSSELNSK